MDFLGRTRQKIGNSILVKRMARVNRKMHYSSMKHVRTIGIVWDASRTGDFNSLSKFHQKMHERDIDVKVMGYYEGRELPDQYTAIRYLSCVRKNELNFFYIPVSDDIESFIRKNFDVLVDMNFDNKLPLRYITSLSHAGLKAGLPDGNQSDSALDLMIDIRRPVSVEVYLDELLRYLEMIDSGQPKKTDKNESKIRVS